MCLCLCLCVSQVLRTRQRTAGELLVGVAVVDGAWFDQKESELIFGLFPDISPLLMPS